MPRPTWDRLPEERRQAVIRAAEAEFAAKGFAAGSLNVVARNAGVAKGSLFQYFDDKNDLIGYLALLASVRIREALEETIFVQPWDTDFFAGVKATIAAWVEHYYENPRDLAVTALNMIAPDPETQDAVWASVMPHYLQVLPPLIQLGVDIGVLREDLDQDAAIEMLILTLPMMGIATRVPAIDPLLGIGSEDIDTRRAAAHRLVDLWIRAMESPTNPQKRRP